MHIVDTQEFIIGRSSCQACLLTAPPTPDCQAHKVTLHPRVLRTLRNLSGSDVLIPGSRYNNHNACHKRTGIFVFQSSPAIYSEGKIGTYTLGGCKCRTWPSQWAKPTMSLSRMAIGSWCICCSRWTYRMARRHQSPQHAASNRKH